MAFDVPSFVAFALLRRLRLDESESGVTESAHPGADGNGRLHQLDRAPASARDAFLLFRRVQSNLHRFIEDQRQHREDQRKGKIFPWFYSRFEVQLLVCLEN